MRRKLFLSTLSTLLVMSGILAFKANKSVHFFTSGTVYCTSTCPTGQQVAFKIDPAGTNTRPCPGNAQPYVIGPCSGTIGCNATPAGTTFSTTTDQ